MMHLASHIHYVCILSLVSGLVPQMQKIMIFCLNKAVSLTNQCVATHIC